MWDIPYNTQAIQFIAGFIGTSTYFMCLKYNFLNVKLDKPEKNSNNFLDNYYALLFFCILGGLIPAWMNIGQPIGCFIQGLIIRPTLSSFYNNHKG